MSHHVASQLDLVEILVRLSLATVLGVVLGLDREVRGHAAGIRTHGVVSLSSAVITVSALMLFADLRTAETQPDPLRVVQGLAQAIGFIAAGLIFVKGADVHNVTTAANLWLATAVGIACGAGQWEVVTIAVVLGVVLVAALHGAKRWLPDADARDDPGEG